MNELDIPVYKAMARKDLSFGCKYHGEDIKGGNEGEFLFGNDVAQHEVEYGEYMSIDAEYTLILPDNDNDEIEDEGKILYEIIGHPVLLSDVLAYLLKKGSGKDFTVPSAIFAAEEYDDVIELWNMTKPTYDEQSEKCKKFIRNLINPV